MADPFLSLNEYVCDGTKTEFEVSFAGGYLSRDHILAVVADGKDVNGNLLNEVEVSFVWVNDYSVSITPAVAVGKILRIYRNTPFSAPIVDFSDGSIVTEATLDLNAKQAVFLAAELRDRFGSIIDPALTAIYAARAEAAANVVTGVKADLASTATGKGASMVGDDDGTNMQAAIDFARLRGLRLSTEFGDRGPGYDNTSNWQDIMAYLAGGTGRGVICAPWHSEIVGELNRDTDTFEGVTLMGMPGLSAIRGDGAYGILRLGDINGMTIDGMGFISDYVNAVEDGGFSLLYNFQRNTKDFALTRNYFSNPDSFTSALTLYTNIGTSNPGYVRDSICDGLLMQGNTFENIGRIVCTLMNRKNDQSAMRNVRVRDNVVKRAGAAAPAITTLPAGLHGMFISLDGGGQNIEVKSNDLRDLQGIGIEFAANVAVGFNGVVVEDNHFTGFTNGLHMLSLDDNVGTGALTNFSVRNNKPLGTLTGIRHSLFFGLNQTSLSENNVYASEATDQGGLIRRCTGFRFFKDKFLNANATTGRYAALLEAGTANSEFEDCTFDTAASASQFAVIRASGATVVDNRITGENTRIIKGTGGSDFDEVASATRNTVASYIGANGEKSREFLSFTMPDADTTLSGLDAMKCYKMIRLTGTLTAQRVLSIPHRRLIEERPTAIRNDTNWTIQLQVNGVAGEVIHPGWGGLVVFDVTLNSARLERTSRPTYCGSFTVAGLPSAAGAGRGATAYVTDGAAAPVFNAAVAGGGATLTPVTSNGTAWVNG